MSFWSVVVNGSPVDFATLGLNVTREFSGLGMPPITHNLQSYALQPGALYQSSKVQPRTLALTVDLEGSSYANMHTLRQALVNIFAPIAPYYTPAVRIYYSGGTRPVYADFRYLSGLEWLGYDGFNQQVPLQLIATDPLWYEDDAETYSLGGQGSISKVNYIIQRRSGVWGSLTTGTNGGVFAIVPDTANNRFCVGGAFSSASGVSGTNAIAWWSNTYQTWNAFAGGGISGGSVSSIALAANGDVWACSGTRAYHYISASDTWEYFEVNSPSVVACHYSGTTYIGGPFTNYLGAAYLVAYFGGDWTTPGVPSGINEIYAMVIAPNGDLYVGGKYDNATTGYVYKLTGATWSQVAIIGGTNPTVTEMVVDQSGNLYIGGTFDTANSVTVNNIAKVTGTTVTALGSGLAANVAGLFWGSGSLYASTSGSGKVYRWNGTAWYELNIILPSGSTSDALAAMGSTLLVGFNDNSGDVTFPASSSVTPISTAAVFPVITLTLSSGSAVLSSITNETTGHVIYLNYTMSAGEMITIDLSPGKKTIMSSTQGAIAYAILEGSDLANFCLIGAQENTISVNSDNSDVNAALSFQTAHWSADGGSA
jgi:hypothetical protein